MVNRIIYLYRAFPTKIVNLLSQESLGVYRRQGTNLVAIDLNTITDIGLRQKIVKDYSLREFEIEQDKFLLLIKSLPKLGAYLTFVEISKRYATEYEDQLIAAIQSQDLKSVCTIIEECWSIGADIQAIEFLCNGNRIRFTRLAELDLSANEIDINKILNAQAIGVLAGFAREGD